MNFIKCFETLKIIHLYKNHFMVDNLFMAQVSRRILPKEVQEKIYEIFWQSLALCKNKNTVASFLEDLLTPTEKVMLAKRVSIAFLLLKGYDYRTINQTLKVSNPTIWLVKTWLKNKGEGYRRILNKILRDERWAKFWEDLDSTIQKILFPTPGKGVNWKEARRKQWETIRKRQKAF